MTEKNKRDAPLEIDSNDQEWSKLFARYIFHFLMERITITVYNVVLILSGANGITTTTRAHDFLYTRMTVVCK
jgi:hypothetical protein